jgi:hypothetical protein
MGGHRAVDRGFLPSEPGDDFSGVIGGKVYREVLAGTAAFLLESADAFK